MKFIFNFEKRHFWVLAILVVIIGVSFVIAQIIPAPNPGHTITQVGGLDDGSKGGTANNGIVDAADSVPWNGITGMPAGFADGIDDVGGGGTTYDTSSLDATVEDSLQQQNLIAQGCVKLNNEDTKYGGNKWMACPSGMSMVAITDDVGENQDAFCCPGSGGGGSGGESLECVSVRRYEDTTAITVTGYSGSAPADVSQIVTNDPDGAYANAVGGTQSFGFHCRADNGWVRTGCAHFAGGSDNDAQMDGNGCYADKQDNDDAGGSALDMACCRGSGGGGSGAVKLVCVTGQRQEGQSPTILDSTDGKIYPVTDVLEVPTGTGNMIGCVLGNGWVMTGCADQGDGSDNDEGMGKNYCSGDPKDNSPDIISIRCCKIVMQ